MIKQKILVVETTIEETAWFGQLPSQTQSGGTSLFMIPKQEYQKTVTVTFLLNLTLHTLRHQI